MDLLKRFYIDELYIYGSQRHGVLKADTFYTEAEYTAPSYESDSLLPSQINRNSLTQNGATNYTTGTFKFSRGAKQYELSNHLGNVLVTIQDRKWGIQTTAGNYANYYLAYVVTVTDYYAFGSGIKERNVSFSSTYRYGMNTQEKEPELGEGITSAEFWMYDGKLGRRWNVDVKFNAEISGYSCFMNNPIFLIDIKGDSAWFFYQKVGSAEATWNYHAEVDDNLKIKTGESNGVDEYATVKGYQNLLVANGDVNEPQAGEAMDHNMATYSFYGKDGTTTTVIGLTLANSDANKTSIDEGIYQIKREKPIQHFKWRVLNSAGVDNIPCRDGKLNKNAPNQVNQVMVNGNAVLQGYKTGIFLHTAFSDKIVGNITSVGCQTVKKTDYDILDKKMSALIKENETYTYILSRKGGEGNPVLPDIVEYKKGNFIPIEPMPNDNIGKDAPNGIKIPIIKR